MTGPVAPDGDDFTRPTPTPGPGGATGARRPVRLGKPSPGPLADDRAGAAPAGTRPTPYPGTRPAAAAAATQPTQAVPAPGSGDGDGGEPPSPPRRFWRRGEPAEPDAKKSLWREIPVLILVALVLALLIKTFVVQPFYIPSGSMERTLNINDRVLVNKMIYHFRDVKRGEIVVFNIEGTGFERYATPLKSPSNIVSRGFRNLENLFGLGPNNKDFIKRVIAIGGDTVACCDAQGRVTVNGKGLDEPYVYRDGPDEPNKRFGPVKIAKGNLWVMGDHRNNSEDSRVGGQVPQKKVVGQAFVRVWPLSKWRGFGVPKTFSQFTGAAGAGVGVAVPLFWWRRRRRPFRDLGLVPTRRDRGSGGAADGGSTD